MVTRFLKYFLPVFAILIIPKFSYSYICRGILLDHSLYLADQRQAKDLAKFYYDKAHLDPNLSFENIFLLDKIRQTKELRPNDSWLNTKELSGQNYNLELELLKQFMNEYPLWRKSLEGKLSAEELSLVDVTMYLRALLPAKFKVDRISNLSLIVDDFYGSLLYQKYPDYIVDIGDFLGLRRNLALAQTTYFGAIAMDKEMKKAVKSNSPEELKEKRSAFHLLPKDQRVKIVEFISDYILKYIPIVGPVVREVFKIIEPASPVDPIATNIAKRYLEEPWMPELLRRFRYELREKEQDTRQNRKTSDISPKELSESVFDVALRAANGDKEHAIVLIGLMSIQRKALIRNLARQYKASAAYDDLGMSLKDSVSTYYLITEVAEQVEYHRGKAGYSKSFNFLYQGKLSSTNNKFYHYWSEAFIAYHMRKTGFQSRLVVGALSNVGRVYEVMTSFSGIQMFKELGMNVWDSFLMTRIKEDMRLHKEGSKFGVEIFDNQSENDVHYNEPAALQSNWIFNFPKLKFER